MKTFCKLIGAGMGIPYDVLVKEYNSSYSVILSIVLRWIVQLFNLVDRIPVIGFVNHLAGAVCGFLVAFLLIYLLVSLILGWVPQAALDQIGLTRTAVEHSVLLGAFAPD